jgi:DNA-binding HxlR family transcriptional regulator
MNRYEQARQFIEVLDGRWTLAVLAQLDVGGRRYQELHHGLDGIAHKVLTETLRRGERDGLVTRHLDRGRVETDTFYQLTELGRFLNEPLDVLERWIDRNWSHVEAARRQWSLRKD